jgi:hypothetical protein
MRDRAPESELAIITGTISANGGSRDARGAGDGGCGGDGRATGADAPEEGLEAGADGGTSDDADINAGSERRDAVWCISVELSPHRVWGSHGLVAGSAVDQLMGMVAVWCDSAWRKRKSGSYEEGTREK